MSLYNLFDPLTDISEINYRLCAVFSLRPDTDYKALNRKDTKRLHYLFKAMVNVTITYNEYVLFIDALTL